MITVALVGALTFVGGYYVGYFYGEKDHRQQPEEWGQ